MKKNKVLKMLLFCMVGILGFTSCDSEDEFQVSESVQTSFIQKYGDIGDVKWEGKQTGYLVADFWRNGKELEAWFTADGAWVLTEIDQGESLDNLPESVKRGFSTTVYANSPYRIDDINQIVRPFVPDVFIIEVEQPRAEDLILHFDMVGKLLEVTSGDYLAKYL